MIFDLTSPAGHSVNDGIDAEEWSLQYIKVYDIRYDMFLLRIYFIFRAFGLLAHHQGRKEKITNFHMAWKAITKIIITIGVKEGNKC